MSERLPVTARGTEPARATVVGSVFDLHGLRCRSDPATAAADETEMQAAVSRPNLAFPLLPMQVEVGGRGDLGVEFRRRQLLRRPPDLRRALALGHPQSVVDDRRGVDLHGPALGLAAYTRLRVSTSLRSKHISSTLQR